MVSVTIIHNKTHKIQLAKTPYSSLLSIVPPIVNKVLSFEFDNANVDIVNGLRRTLLSEVPIKHLTVSLGDIKTTDHYIIAEAIRKRLEMVPIAQNVDIDSVFAIRLENDTDECIDVLSDNIKLNGVATSKDVMPSIPICSINSGTTFTINDINVVESYGYNNACVSIGRVGYEILDDFKQSSQVATPTKFRMVIETPGILNPMELVRNAIDSLISRLDAIDYGRAIVEFGIYKLTISNETYTIGNLLTRYIYVLEPTINYVASRVTHPSKRECTLDIYHPSGEKLCQQAVDAIKKDLISVRKAFK